MRPGSAPTGKKKVPPAVNNSNIKELHTPSRQARRTIEELKASIENRKPPEPAYKQTRTSGKKRNEIINDPAVKTVLLGLDAIVTDVEENPSN